LDENHNRFDQIRRIGGFDDEQASLAKPEGAKRQQGVWIIPPRGTKQNSRAFKCGFFVWIP